MHTAIPPTQAPSWPQARAGAPEIEVTPAMIEAAAAVLTIALVYDLSQGWLTFYEVAGRMVAAAL